MITCAICFDNTSACDCWEKCECGWGNLTTAGRKRAGKVFPLATARRARQGNKCPNTFHGGSR